MYENIGIIITNVKNCTDGLKKKRLLSIEWWQLIYQWHQVLFQTFNFKRDNLTAVFRCSVYFQSRYLVLLNLTVKFCTSLSFVHLTGRCVKPTQGSARGIHWRWLYGRCSRFKANLKNKIKTKQKQKQKTKKCEMWNTSSLVPSFYWAFPNFPTNQIANVVLARHFKTKTNKNKTKQNLRVSVVWHISRPSLCQKRDKAAV